MPIDFAEPTPKLSPSETTGCTIPLSRIHLLIKDKEIAEYDEGTAINLDRLIDDISEG